MHCLRSETLKKLSNGLNCRIALFAGFIWGWLFLSQLLRCTALGQSNYLTSWPRNWGRIFQIKYTHVCCYFDCFSLPYKLPIFVVVFICLFCLDKFSLGFYHLQKKKRSHNLYTWHLDVVNQLDMKLLRKMPQGIAVSTAVLLKG